MSLKTILEEFDEEVKNNQKKWDKFVPKGFDELVKDIVKKIYQTALDDVLNCFPTNRRVIIQSDPLDLITEIKEKIKKLK